MALFSKLVCASAAFGSASGFLVPASGAHSMVKSRVGPFVMDVEATRDSAPAAAGPITAWQQPALAKVTSTLALTAKEYPADLGFDAFTIDGSSGKVESFEGPGLPNIAWCSGLNMGGGTYTLASVSAFCGPLTDVPHLIASCGVSPAGVELYIDFRPRADGAYDPAYATLADYPAPETREAFAEGGNRKDFAGAYFTDELLAWRAGLLALDGATPAAPLSKEQTATISAGPMLIDITLPHDAAETAAAACTEAVERWLNWMVNAEEMKRALPAGMRQTATYTRDTKVRANHFGFLYGRYTAKFGEGEGKALATADAGPLDEAYVGGGS